MYIIYNKIACLVKHTADNSSICWTQNHMNFPEIKKQILKPIFRSSVPQGLVLFLVVFFLIVNSF